jgi:penicillin amidase
VAGHNEDIGWGMTNVTVDDLDFYLETIHPSDSNQYLLDGEWREMRIVKEEIPVKGSDEPAVRYNRYTHRGPVVSEFKGVEDKVLSIRWQGNAMSNELRTIHLLNRAKNWEDFRDAVRTFNSVNQNIVYADRQGNIGLQTSAGIPVRHSGGILVYPGDTSLFDWKGIIPFEELPYSYNPECGYVSSANNKTVDGDYPYYIGTWFSLPWRIGRIREMLEEKEKLGTEDFKRMLRDQHSLKARKMTPLYLEALKDLDGGEYRQAYEILSSWDYDMHVNSSAALIFEIMWMELHSAMFGDELGERLELLAYNPIAANLIEKTRVKGHSLWCDNVNTPEITESFQDNIRTAFVNSVDSLTAMYGPDASAWKWGELHKVALMHPLGGVPIVEKLFKVNRGPFPVGGSSHTVCPYTYPRGSSFIADHGASERHIFHTMDWDRSLTVIPTGTSGIPASPHYLDQTVLYVNNQYHRDHFSREAVESNYLYRAVFE